MNRCNARIKRLLLLDMTLAVLCFAVAPCVTWMLAAWPDCYIAQMGMLCPACGGTRAVAALCRGDLLTAVRMNVLVVFVLVYALLVLLIWHIEVLLRQKWARILLIRLLNYRIIIGWAVAAALFALVRNIV